MSPPSFDNDNSDTDEQSPKWDARKAFKGVAASKSNPWDFGAKESGISGVRYGNDFQKPREPRDGETVNAHQYFHTIPFYLQEKMREMGYVGLYYSLPALEFAQVVRYVFNILHQREGSPIISSEDIWSQTYDANHDAHILTLKLELVDSIAFINVIAPVKYPNGSIILISSDSQNTVMITEYFTSVRKIALEAWTRKMHTDPTVKIALPTNDPDVEDLI